MHRHIRSLLFLLGTLVVGACSVTDSPLKPRLSPVGATPTFLKINATDSAMALTGYRYPDTATALTRVTALASDVSVSAVIGTAGGELSIPSAGIVMKIPAGALSANVPITMTALAGTAVAYSFKPHGTVFAKPVKLEQSLLGTAAIAAPTLLNNAHAAYFNTSLDSAYVDAARTRVKVTETQLTYHDATSAKLTFSIGHFSGYLVACGHKDERELEAR